MWIYEPKFSEADLVTTSTLLKDNFSPILAVLATTKSATVPSVPSTAKALTSSNDLASLAKAVLAIVSTNSTNSAFLVTKSVSQLTSIIAALSPSIITFAKPSAAILSAFLAALAIPFSLNQLIAASMSPLHSVNAFLQSIIPAPV